MNDRKMALDGNRRVENGRLIYYHRTPDRDSWDELWMKNINPEYYIPFQLGKLQNFEKIFKRHLPKNGLILEAGCGASQWVVALKALGYNCMGLDYAINTMLKTRQILGPINLISGDLTALGISNDAFDAIISLGVVEHRQSGPGMFLDEMNRILKSGGLLLISVPYFNPLRLWRAKRGAYQDDVHGLEFYQYAFTKKEFCKYLENAGYKVEVTYSYSPQNSVSQELHWLRNLHPFFRKLAIRLVKYISYLYPELGHMLLVVARKK